MKSHKVKIVKEGEDSIAIERLWAQRQKRYEQELTG